MEHLKPLWPELSSSRGLAWSTIISCRGWIQTLSMCSQPEPVIFWPIIMRLGRWVRPTKTWPSSIRTPRWILTSPRTRRSITPGRRIHSRQAVRCDQMQDKLKTPQTRTRQSNRRQQVEYRIESPFWRRRLRSQQMRILIRISAAVEAKWAIIPLMWAVVRAASSDAPSLTLRHLCEREWPSRPKTIMATISIITGALLGRKAGTPISQTHLMEGRATTAHLRTPT